MKNLSSILLAAVLLVLFNQAVFSATKVSVKSGPFGYASTWSDGIAPAAGDDIVISAGHSVYDAYATIANLTVRGTFTVRDVTVLETVMVDSTGVVGSLSGGYTSKFRCGIIVNNGSISNGTLISSDVPQTISGIGVWTGGIEYAGEGAKTVASLFSKNFNLVKSPVIVAGIWEVTNGNINKADIAAIGGDGTIVFKGNGTLSSNESLGNLFTAPIIVATGGRGATNGSVSSAVTIKGGASLGSHVSSLFGIKGDLWVEPGAALNGNGITLGGANVHNDGLINPVSLSFNRAGDQAISGNGEWRTSNGVQIEGTGIKSLSNSIAMNVGSLGIDSTLNINEHTLTFNAGTFTKRPTGSVTGSGRIVFKGTGNLNSNESLGNLFTAAIEINTGTRSVTTSSGFSAPVLIESGATFSTHLNQTATLKEDVTVETGGSLVGQTLAFAGVNFVNDGTVNPVKVLFTRDGNQTISGAGIWKSPNGIDLNGSGVKLLTSDVHMQTGALNVNTVLDIGGNTLTFTNGNFNKQLPGSVAGTGLIRFFGTGKVNSYTADGNLFTVPIEIATGSRGPVVSGYFDAPVTVKSGANLGMSLHVTMHLRGDMTLESGATVTGEAFAFYGQNFVNNGKVSPVVTSFKSGSHNLSGNGSFGGNGTTMESGSDTVLQQGIQQFGNLSLQSGSAFDISNQTLKIAGNLTNRGTMITDGSTIEYNRGNGDQTVTTNIAYHNLVINNPHQVFLGASETVGNILRLERGIFEIYTNRLTIDDCAQIVRAGGVLNGTPVFLSDCNSVVYEGAAPMVTGTELPNAVGTLIINNPAGVTLSKNVSVSDALTLQADLIAGDFVVTMQPAAVSVGTADVVGNVRRVGILNNVSYSFGNPFNTISFDTGAAPSEVTVNLVKAAPEDLTNAILRTYNITPLGGSNYTATLRLRYDDAELNGNDESMLQFFHSNGAWTPVAASNRDEENNWVETSGVTSFSPWTLAEVSPSPERQQQQPRQKTSVPNPNDGKVFEAADKDNRR